MGVGGWCGREGWVWEGGCEVWREDGMGVGRRVVWEGRVGMGGWYGRVGVKGGVGGKREKESNGCHLVARIRNIMLKYISILPLNSYKKTTS